jgi:Na+/H+-dicarboxylate symporter
MTTTALIAEFLLSGLIIIVAIFFISLSILGIHDLKFLSELKDLSTMIILLISAVAYFLGALLQRLISPRVVFNALCRISLLKNSLLKPGGQWTPEHGKALYAVLQYGSEHLIMRVQYKQSMTRLITSAIITLPFLGISLTAWLFTGYGWRSGLLSLIVFTVIWALTIIAGFQAHMSFNRVILYSRQAIQNKI